MQRSTGVLSTQRQAEGDTRGPGATENNCAQSEDKVAAGCGWWTCDRDKHTKRRVTCYHAPKLQCAWTRGETANSEYR